MARYTRKTKEITIEDAIAAAKAYEGSRSEFSKQYSGFYRKLLQHGVVNEYLPRKIARNDHPKISRIDNKPELPQRWFPLESDFSRPK